MIKFEWHSTKAVLNQDKRGIRFQEAQSVFYDEFAVQFFDNELFEAEDRFPGVQCVSSNTGVTDPRWSRLARGLSDTN